MEKSTLGYKTHAIPKLDRENRGNIHSFVFNDVMGLEEGSGRGISEEDMNLVLKGHVKDGYKFKPDVPLSSDDPHYNPSPSPGDKAHVLVWVCSANAAEIKESVLQKMKVIREAASDMDIPQLALVTKVDEACGETEKDLKNVYRSKYLKEKMTNFSTALGVPLNCTLPVKNYSEETDVDDDVDCLILSALKMMINFGDDLINSRDVTAVMSGASSHMTEINTTLENPWRRVSWENLQEDLQYASDYQTNSTNVNHLKVLLCGPVGAGKSSFINSVRSALRRRISASALANPNNEQSFTKRYKIYETPKWVTRTSFVFCDIMGLEEGSGRGITVEDIKLVLKGHVKDGYKFNPVSPLCSDDPHYNPSPSPNDKVHVLVWVCSASSAEMKESVLQKMKAIREAASDMGVPQLALVTKADEVFGETKKDLKNVYKSKHLKEKMTDFSTALGVPLSCILPVKNYSEEIEVDNDVDCLILSALRMMINFGDNFINDTLATE